ncbi:retrovirus-related pol polyprotein from transposon TNT 1-94 [Tanacetum coccineum]|uniref:Retrovirus-related pol polyprotein from transposon TNT 1-94 n=1 Tax=Tanacetum coccineum TaxID=301880 RepID=A0ABQ5EBL4_9ASTR
MIILTLLWKYRRRLRHKLGHRLRWKASSRDPVKRTEFTGSIGLSYMELVIFSLTQDSDRGLSISKKLQEPLAEPIAYNFVKEKTTYDMIKALPNMYEKLIDIKFDDEVHALLLLSSLAESWSGTVTVIEAGVGSKTEARSSRTEYLKPLALKDKEVSIAAGDSDDAFVCCVENTSEDRIMDFGASFHATYSKEELEGFKLRSSLAMDIEGLRGDAGPSPRPANSKLGMRRIPWDVVLKTSFGTSWTLKRRLIYVGQLDEEVEGHSYGIRITIDGRGSATLWHQRIGHMNDKDVFNTFKRWKAVLENETNLWVKCLKSDNGGEYTSRDFIEYYAENGIKMLKTISESLNRTVLLKE